MEIKGEVSSKTLREIDKEKEKENMQKVEAVLFISGKFLSMQELIAHTDLNPIVIREVIEKLREKYDKIGSAIEIFEKAEDNELNEISGGGEAGRVGGGNELWKMNVRKEFSYLINRLATGSSEFSKSEQETLAIIAYKQPIKQSVVIKIRGNKAYDHVKKFAGLGLLKKKRIGHTYELSLSDDFYDYFSVGEKGIHEKDIGDISEKSIKEKDVKEKSISEKINSGEDVSEKSISEKIIDRKDISRKGDEEIIKENIDKGAGEKHINKKVISDRDISEKHAGERGDETKELKLRGE